MANYEIEFESSMTVRGNVVITAKTESKAESRITALLGQCYNVHDIHRILEKDPSVDWVDANEEDGGNWEVVCVDEVKEDDDE